MVAASRCGKEKRKVDFLRITLSKWDRGRVVVKDCMGNQTNSMFVEERDRKNLIFLKIGAVCSLGDFRKSFSPIAFKLYAAF